VQLYLPAEALRVLPAGIGDAPSLKADEAGDGSEAQDEAGAEEPAKA
jgi:hypothetical protein